VINPQFIHSRATLLSLLAKLSCATEGNVDFITSADFDRVATEWAVGNYVRIAVILTAVVLVMASMIRIARDTAPAKHR